MCTGATSCLKCSDSYYLVGWGVGTQQGWCAGVCWRWEEGTCVRARVRVRSTVAQKTTALPNPQPPHSCACRTIWQSAHSAAGCTGMPLLVKSRTLLQHTAAAPRALTLMFAWPASLAITRWESGSGGHVVRNAAGLRQKAFVWRGLPARGGVVMGGWGVGWGCPTRTSVALEALGPQRACTHNQARDLPCPALPAPYASCTLQTPCPHTPMPACPAHALRSPAMVNAWHARVCSRSRAASTTSAPP